MAKRRTRFLTWAKRDPNDERKIVYTFKESDGEVLHFTSEDIVPFSMLSRIRDAWIEQITLKDNAWYAVLYEDRKGAQHG